MAVQEIVIPKVCKLDLTKMGWGKAEIDLFVEGFKRCLFSFDKSVPDDEWNDFVKRGYSFCDKAKTFCEIHRINIKHLKNSGVVYEPRNANNKNARKRIPIFSYKDNLSIHSGS